ncbi:phage terminase large subunit family protein [Roseibacterium beibuensis]|uniref:Phage terminase large subunit family protein n=1 Tax=[Roseibacterium] beibuensis TaxID=1193142 RepID=A0ABP9L8V9_9RHOB|nr:phage terminase large subunit family protein [Roseibacterium beibuensis]MCS6624349.1 phage terminase large subunit family protein [Roseibacterium beibuensis]
MVEISDGRIGAVQVFAPLPDFVTAQEIMADALPMIDPPSRMSVTEAAAQYVRVPIAGAWGQFDAAIAPYLVEPSNTTQSRLYRTCALLGPSQTGKTFALQTVVAHAITCDQSDALIVHMTQPDRDKWVEQKLRPMIENSPALKERLGRGRDDATFSRMRFRGMTLMIGYPTRTMLSGGTYRLVLLTDYDHMPVALGQKDSPEGSPAKMARNRVRTHMSRGCVLVESSPAFPVIDPSWSPRPEAPHELPPVAAGIVLIYNDGTRGRWHWECPDCGGEFEPRIDRLEYDRTLDPGAAGAAAMMVCPHCGSLIAHRHKVELNRAALKGRGGWRHEGRDGQLVALGDAAIRETDTGSWAINGAVASFASWAEIVQHLEEARRKAETLGDETDLATVYYTEIGLPYRRERREGEADELTVAFLRDHAQKAEKGVAPSWCRAITISVDVQGTYFAVQVTAWGEDGMGQVVDRFDLTQPPEDAPDATPDQDGNRRRLEPHRYLEDWAVLDQLEGRVVPVEGQGFGLRPIGIVVDFHGLPGVSDHAEAFWKAKRAEGKARRWYIQRGQGGWKVPARVRYAAPEGGSQGNKARAIKLLTIATDRLKDTLDNALHKSATGARGAFYLGSWMTGEKSLEGQVQEYVAEIRESDGWKPKPGLKRNEGTDLTVMGRGLAEHKGLLRQEWTVPSLEWTLGPDNPLAVALAKTSDTESGQDGDGAASPPTPQPDPAPRPRGGGGIRYLKGR